MIDYLKEHYDKTKWPFFLVRDLIRQGVFDANEANNLVKEGIIRPREGMHGKLVELIIKDNPLT